MVNKKKKSSRRLLQSKLNPEQELFCYYYATHESTRFNGTRSYLAAYDPTGEKEMSENVAHTSGSRLLLNVTVNDRINKLIDESISNEVVDHELHKVVRQDEERGPKIQAIREYNKLKGRITEKHEVETTVSLSELLKASRDRRGQDRQVG